MSITASTYKKFNQLKNGQRLNFLQLQKNLMYLY